MAASSPRSSEVDGLPVPGKFSGQDLAIHLLEDARKVGVQIVEAGVAKLELDKRLTLTDQDNKTYHPEAIIVASGASLRKLGVPGEEEFTGAASRVARRAMAVSFAARMSSSSAAATARCRKRSCSPRPADA